MRIVVTGVTGQIGGALLGALRQHGEIVAADRTILELARPAEIAQRLDRLTPDLIVNPAAYTAVDEAEDERDLAMCINGEAPGAMARWAAARAVPFIHFSTDYVFDGSGQRPWREDDPPRPLSAYGASKLAGENEIRAAGGCFLIVRTSWVYAASGNNFLCTIARLARERKELRVVSDQFGAPTSAAQIAGIVADIIGKNPGRLDQLFNRAGGLVHLAASGETSWHGFAKAIVDGLTMRGRRLTVENIVAIDTEARQARARRPLNSRLDTTRLREVFGAKPESWQFALATELDRFIQETGASA